MVNQGQRRHGTVKMEGSSKRKLAYDLGTPLRYCPSARILLTLGLIVHLLLFLRIGVLWAPGYTYRGPTGADRVFYYAYVRSLVIDRDLDLTNEIAMRPPSTGLMVEGGKPLNKYPIGTPLLSLPTFALTHGLVLAGNSLGLTHVEPDGYSPPYALSYAVTQMLWALFGAWLMYRALLRYFDPQTAALAVVTTWFSVHALHYVAVDLMMSHAAAVFSIAWCSYEAVRLRESPGQWSRWFAVGASSALAVLVRYQDAVYLIVPACAGLIATAHLMHTDHRKRLLALAGCGAAGFGLIFAPQVVAWRAIFGSWVTNSYQREFSFHWLTPPFREVLCDPVTGLAVWLPALALGLAGCFALAVRRRDLIAGAAGIAWVANLYVISCWWAWLWIVHRSSFDMLFPLCLGFGFAISCFWRRWPRAALVVALALMAWNIPFAVLPGAATATGASGFAAWLDCVLVLLRMKRG
jgi:hypothetical protein